jgi:hypothetical protein
MLAPFFSLARGQWIPCVVVTWDPDTGEYRRVEGPDGFAEYEQAVKAARFRAFNARQREQG